MKIAVTLKGIENIISLDLDGRKILPGRIEFHDSNKLQGVNTTYELIKRFNFKSLDDIKKEVESINFNIRDSFKILCNREGSHNFKSLAVEREIGEILFNKGFKVDIHNPKTIIFIDIIRNACLVGYLEKYNMSKRSYRFKINNQSINALLAYAMIRFSGITKNDSILDPFCKDAIIPLEAYFYGIKKIHAFDTLKNNLYNSDINIRLAKANIELKQYEMEKLSAVISDVDYIITNLSHTSGSAQTQELKKIISEFFTQSSKILKEKMVIVTPKPELVLELSKDLFSIESNFDVEIGSRIFTIFRMKKLSD